MDPIKVLNSHVAPTLFRAETSEQ